MIAVPSPSGELLATTTIADNGRRVIIRNVRRDLRVQSTVRRSGSAASTAFPSMVHPRLEWLSDTRVVTVGTSENATVILTVFDVTRGVVAYTLEYSAASGGSSVTRAVAEDDVPTLQYTWVDWAVSNQTLVVAVTTRKSKCVLLVYHGATGKLERKVKAGKETTSRSALAVTSQWAAWHGGSSLRITSLQTGDKVKVSLKSRFVPVVAVAADVGCTVQDQALVMFDRTGRVLDGATIPVKTADTTTTTSCTVQLVQSPSNDSYWLWQDATLTQFTVTDDTYNLLQTRPLQLPKSTDSNDWTYQYRLLSTQFVVTRYSHSQTTSVHGGVQQYTIDLDSVTPNDQEVLDITFSETTAKATPESSTKRKHDAVVLGPGQAGGEAPSATDARTKRLKRDVDDDTSPTIAERLAQLQQVLDEDDDDDMVVTTATAATTFSARGATTESLTHVLSQALQSNDSGMLEQALAVREAPMVRATCRALPPAHAVSLLHALTMRLATKPARAEQLVPWIAAVLQSNHVQNVEQLQPLQNLLQERLEVFPLLLQLEGRLEHLTAL